MTGSSPPTNLGLGRLLLCAALEPALNGLLLIDLAPDALLPVVDTFLDLLRLRSDCEPVRRIVGSADDDDDLWVASAPIDPGRLESMISVPGPVASGTWDSPTVLVIPDLGRLSIAAARAAVVTLSAPLINLERHGISASNTCNLYWIASCASEDIGRVSQHLLDRFSIRFPAAHAVVRPEPVYEVLDAVSGEPGIGPQIHGPPSRWAAVVHAGCSVPEITPDAVDRALELHAGTHEIRRPLALLRLARACATLERKPHVTRAAVDDAAVLIQLMTPTPPSGAGPNQDDRQDMREPEQHVGALDVVVTTSQSGPVAAAPADTTAVVAAPVLQGSPAEALGAVMSELRSTGPYPEDFAEPQREVNPLLLPWQRRSRNGFGDRGVIIGTTPTSRVHDIAWVDTVRQAAKFQRVRRRRGAAGTSDSRMLVTGADLRRYRRAPETEYLLVLVLDHTCRRSADWLPALAEHLRRAYVQGAAVCLVEVGGAGTASPLRAECTVLRSVLHPRVVAALHRGAGGATPLAHGLHLALETLRHALQHGRAPISSAWLTIMTDGLGNVPLSASLRGAVNEPVTNQGIRDALGVAQELAQLRNVESVVIAARESPYPSIPYDLAEALGPKCMIVPSDEIP